MLLAAALLLADFVPAAPVAGTSVSSLVAVLKSNSSQKEKADACRELARVGDSEAVSALAALLPDEQLSHMARYALETIPGPAVDKALREALGKSHGRPLIGVIGSIGVRRDAQAVPQLVQLLRAEQPEVAEAAARALGSIGNTKAAKALNAALTNVPQDEQLAVCEGLLRCAERFASGSHKAAARAIYDRLRALPGPSQVRAAAWRGAILVRRPDALPLLLQALRSDDYLLFSTATRVARELPGSEATRALAAALPQLPPENQVVLIQLLGQRGDPAAIPALFAAAAHVAPTVSVAALNALTSIATAPENSHANLATPMIPVFTSLLFHHNADIARAAQDGLAALPGQAADQAVLALLDSKNNRARRLVALDLIARRRMTGTVPQLFELAQGPDAELRIAAYKRLGELAEPNQLPGLLNLLTAARAAADMDAAEQALATASSRATDPELWAQRLQARWELASPALRGSLIRVLSGLGGTNAFRCVRLAASDSDPEVRSTALRALSAWPNGEGASALLTVARSTTDPAEQTLALRGVLDAAAQTELAVDQRLSFCRDAAPLLKTDDQKKHLLAALGNVSSPGALKLIDPLLDEPALKSEACTAAVNVSEKLLHDHPDASREEIISALEHVIRLEPKQELLERARKALAAARAKAKT